MAARCREALETQDPRFIPERWEKVYRDWLTDIRDWCISRASSGGGIASLHGS